MPLTPNNREEHWLQGMVDGSTTLEPNKRREYWYKEIVDAIGSGGGGGGGGVLVVNDNNGTLTKTWAEITTAAASSIVVLIIDGGGDNGTAYSYLESSFASTENDYYEVVFRKEGTTISYFCASSTDYPVLDA